MREVHVLLQIPIDDDWETLKLRSQVTAKFKDGQGNVCSESATAVDDLFLYDFFKARFRKQLDREIAAHIAIAKESALANS